MLDYRKAGSLLLTATIACAPGSEPGRDASGQNGAVTAGHPLAAEAGLAVLVGGGNAMDAAITMAGVLAVARPHMNGVGGDMFLIYYDAKTGEVHALNGSGRAGTRATLAELRSRGLEEMPGAGPTSVSVPGAVGAWAHALERFGTMSLSDALAPAEAIAREGMTVTERLSLDIEGQVEKLTLDDEASRIFLPEGAVPAPGDLLKRPDLAETLSRIRQNGASEMYTGETARMIAEYLDANGGLLTPEDLASFEPEWFTPLRATYHDLEVFALPPNTQGVALASEFTMMNELPMQEMGHNTPDYLHTLTEVIRLAVADRDSSVADPDYMRVSVEALLELERLAAMAASIDPSGNAYSENNADGEDHPNTVYLSVVDSEGNAVSLIQSLFASFGSGLVVPGTGVVLHNRGSLFTFDATHPNVFGPGRRPYHTLSPSMALKDGKPWLVFGTPGGDGQTHTLTQVMNNILLFGMTPQEAIDAPRIRRLANGALAIEDRMDAAVMDALEARGYTVRRRTGWTAEFGGAGAILIDPETGLRRAGADRRREGWSLAY